jgi:hypothetical protein
VLKIITINEISLSKKKISFEWMIHLTEELICGMEWGSFKLFQNYTKQGFKFEHQPSTFGTRVSAAHHFTKHS